MSGCPMSTAVKRNVLKSTDVIGSFGNLDRKKRDFSFPNIKLSLVHGGEEEPPEDLNSSVKLAVQRPSGKQLKCVAPNCPCRARPGLYDHSVKTNKLHAGVRASKRGLEDVRLGSAIFVYTRLGDSRPVDCYNIVGQRVGRRKRSERSEVGKVAIGNAPATFAGFDVHLTLLAK
ncbi:hypothetical protein J6590_089925 [Homalodisca vitripennis]|nr:hypothetical protein J6590_089925 [Homalodisca vitripennis]